MSCHVTLCHVRSGQMYIYSMTNTKKKQQEKTRNWKKIIQIDRSYSYWQNKVTADWPVSSINVCTVKIYCDTLVRLQLNTNTTTYCELLHIILFFVFLPWMNKNKNVLIWNEKLFKCSVCSDHNPSCQIPWQNILC